MPSFADWLKASWGDFRRRWAVLLAVAGLGGAATLAAVFLPFVPAALAATFGLGNPWIVWGAATAVSVLATLWLSTWAQAALLRAALTEEAPVQCLTLAWGQTAAFAWVLSLAMLAIGGGYLFLVLPGLALSVLLFAAPFVSISGEASGSAALGVSWARVKPHFGEVALRLLAATVLAAAPGWIPYVGWLIMLFWAPFGFIALARLDKDLRAAEPLARGPEWMGGAVAALSVALVLAVAGASYAAVRAVASAAENFNQPGGLASRVRPETAQAAVAAFTEPSATDEQRKKAFLDLFNDLKNPPGPQVVTTTAAWTAP